jgi:DNA-directed RNA polymerase subunit RPC12/RpoP
MKKCDHHPLTPVNSWRDGARLRCKQCRRATNTKHYLKHREEIRLRERVRWWKRQGIQISLEDYERLWCSQNGKCAICKKDIALYDKNTCLDHDHETQEERGILCSSCNRGIGLLHDDPEILRTAISYLEKGEI